MSQTLSNDGILPSQVLDSVNAGIYVTDLERRIVCWNQAAQRITGWRADEILGKRCLDQDVGSGRLWISSAGGPEPLLFRAEGVEPAAGITGLPMGLMDQNEYEQIERQLEPGDRLLLFSDGVVEIVGRDSQELGTDGLLRLLRETEASCPSVSKHRSIKDSGKPTRQHLEL